MSRWRLPLSVLALTALMTGVGWGVGRWFRAAPPVPAPDGAGARGSMLYHVHCASCHGADGHGAGSAAADLRPPPRDFAARPWRFEATPDSIRRVTADGIPGTAMPAFRSALSAADLDAVGSHVQQLSARNQAMRSGQGGQAFLSADTSKEARLLHDADFIDLRGIDPPPLRLTNAAGKNMTLLDLRGKLVLLHFWGTGCVHCIQEIPALDDLQKAHAGWLAVLHICAEEDDPVAAQKTLDRLAPGHISHVETSGLGLARFDVQALPSVWLIAPDGKAVGRSSGARNWHGAAATALINVLATRKAE